MKHLIHPDIVSDDCLLKSYQRIKNELSKRNKYRCSFFTIESAICPSSGSCI